MSCEDDVSGEAHWPGLAFALSAISLHSPRWELDAGTRLHGGVQCMRTHKLCTGERGEPSATSSDRDRHKSAGGGVRGASSAWAVGTPDARLQVTFAGKQQPPRDMRGGDPSLVHAHGQPSGPAPLAICYPADSPARGDLKMVKKAFCSLPRQRAHKERKPPSGLSATETFRPPLSAKAAQSHREHHVSAARWPGASLLPHFPRWGRLSCDMGATLLPHPQRGDRDIPQPSTLTSAP